jgi:flagellar biosynthesis component FlhA
MVICTSVAVACGVAALVITVVLGDLVALLFLVPALLLSIASGVILRRPTKK